MKLREILERGRLDDPVSVDPYIIAEAGVNHEGSIEIAYQLIEEASNGGANAIKFQTYKANKIASKKSPAYWDIEKEPTISQYELFQKYDSFGEYEFQQLKHKCDLCGIEFLSTPFDQESAAFLNPLLEVFKISSSDITNKPFIESICQFGKPIILSTGASNHDEIREAIEWIDKCQVPVALLHCVLNYPTNDEDANLGMIEDLRNVYSQRVIGYSDHTLPSNMENLITACSLGASIIEKHFTHDKSLPGNDHYHAMDKQDLQLLKEKLAHIKRSIGSIHKQSLPSEELARKNARRSLVADRKIAKSEIIQLHHLTWKRPATGISPKNIEKVIGCRAARNIEEDEILTKEMLVGCDF